MKNIYTFLILLILPLVSVSAEEVQNLGCSPFIQRPGISTINNRCEYSDGTFSASLVNCQNKGCCQYYLELLQTGKYKQIGSLNCIDLNGELKTYINGKDSNIPTVINTETLNYAETSGDRSPAIAGNNNQVVQQDISPDNKLKWYDKPLGLIAIGIFITIAAYFLINLFKIIHKKYTERRLLHNNLSNLDQKLLNLSDDLEKNNINDIRIVFEIVNIPDYLSDSYINIEKNKRGLNSLHKINSKIGYLNKTIEFNAKNTEQKKETLKKIVEEIKGVRRGSKW